MKKVTTIVLIPIGPSCENSFISDTIQSVIFYLKLDYEIVLVDDSGCSKGSLLKEKFKDITVLETKGSTGHFAGLYFTLSYGLKYVYENFLFDFVLRMDTDALLIGCGLDQVAVDFFKENPDRGIIGSYMVDCNGDPRGIYWTGVQLQKEMKIKFLIKDTFKKFKGWSFLRTVYRKSKKNGYIDGEHCMGGAYLMSWKCVKELNDKLLLDRREIYFTQLQEDQIFGLLIYSIGFSHADFATGDLPMGLRWRGLPCSPQELVKRNKKITHSTRFFENMGEEEIRKYFRERRILKNNS